MANNGKTHLTKGLGFESRREPGFCVAAYRRSQLIFWTMVQLHYTEPLYSEIRLYSEVINHNRSKNVKEPL